MATKKTTLYHSKLVEWTTEGPIPVKVIAPPKPSKYPNKPPYAPLLVNGVEYYYNCENTTIAQQLANLAGRTIMLEAGGRDDEAFINVPIQSGQKHTPPAQQSQQPAEDNTPDTEEDLAARGLAPTRQAAPPAVQDHGPVKLDKRNPVYGGTVGGCLKEAIHLMETHHPSITPDMPGFWIKLHEYVSDLIRVCLLCESGSLALPLKKRIAQPEPAPVRKSSPPPPPAEEPPPPPPEEPW